MRPELKGVVVPMVSPFTAGGRIDEAAAMRLTEHIVVNGCHPFVLGTTGEALSITSRDRMVYLKAVYRANAGRGTLYAGIAGMCLEETILAGKSFADNGAEILVANLPSYYPLPVEYMMRYFTELADALPRPLMIYNIKSTTHMSIPVELVGKLSRHENIIGLKDSERDVERLDTLAAYAKNTPGFYYQLGWAARSVYALRAGADGIVPSTANAFPELYRDLYRASVNGEIKEAERLQALTDELSAVYQKDKLLSQALPGLKIILAELKICSEHCISPCYPLDQEDKQIILKNLKLIMERIK
jgi:4-hydroxy-tetrahydrodipicolinate synthase